MTKIKIFILANSNTPEVIIDQVYKIYDAFKIKIDIVKKCDDIYFFINSILKNYNQADVLGFLDISFIPTSAKSIYNVLDFLSIHRTMVGNIQQSRKEDGIYHDFIGTKCLFINMPYYKIIAKEDFLNLESLEKMHYEGEQMLAIMKHLYPSTFDYNKISNNIIFKYGVYGKGVRFEQEDFFYLNDDFTAENVDYFINICNSILNNNFLPGALQCNDIDNYFMSNNTDFT